MPQKLVASEQIEDGITGFLVPQGNAEEMTKRIIYLLDNDELRAEIGANAAIAAKKRFDLKKQAETYLELYNKII